MPSFPHTFGALAGVIPLSYLDDNFAACAFASDLTATNAVVAALPGTAVPLKPLAGGTAGSGATLSKVDHQHPPQSAAPNLQTGTTYTLQASDDGGVVDIANAAAITVTLPQGLSVGFSCMVVQSGAGQITFVGSGGAILRQRSSQTKTAGQWAGVTLEIRANVGGTAAEYVLIGDMA